MLGMFVLREKLRGESSGLAGVTTGQTHFVYGESKKFSPTAMVLTGGVVALVGLGLLSVSTVVTTKEAPITIDGYNVKKDPPPPPPPVEDVKPTPTPRVAQTVITAPEPKIDIPTSSPPIAKVYDDGPLPPIDGLAGTDMVNVLPPVKPIDPPTILPPPKLVGVKPHPRYAAKFQPDYPSAMIRSATEGVVEVKVLVGTDGKVKDVQILKSADPAFSEATRRTALRDWRFMPATRDGVPYEQWYTTKVIFRLDR